MKDEIVEELRARRGRVDAGTILIAVCQPEWKGPELSPRELDLICLNAVRAVFGAPPIDDRHEHAIRKRA